MCRQPQSEIICGLLYLSSTSSLIFHRLRLSVALLHSHNRAGGDGPLLAHCQKPVKIPQGSAVFHSYICSASLQERPCGIVSQSCHSRMLCAVRMCVCVGSRNVLWGRCVWIHHWWTSFVLRCLVHRSPDLTWQTDLGLSSAAPTAPRAERGNLSCTWKVSYNRSLIIIRFKTTSLPGVSAFDGLKYTKKFNENYRNKGWSLKRD